MSEGFWSSILKLNYVDAFATTASRRMIILQHKQGDGIQTCAEPSPDVEEAFTSALAGSFKSSATDGKISEELSAQLAKAVATEVAPLLYRTQGLQLYRNAINGLCIDRLNGWFARNEENDLKDLYKNTNELKFNDVSKITTKLLNNDTIRIGNTAKNTKAATDSKTENTGAQNQQTTSESTFSTTDPVNIVSYAAMRKYYFDRAVQLISAELPIMQSAQQALFNRPKTGNSSINIGDVTKILDSVKTTPTTTVAPPGSTTIVSGTTPTKTPNCSDGQAPSGTPPVCSDGSPPQ